jgi:hypothetical protein
MFMVEPHLVPSIGVTKPSGAIPTIGLKPQIFNSSTIGEINAAFDTFARERPDALFVAVDAFFVSRVAQFITLTARDRLPATYPIRDFVSAGGLMSYGSHLLRCMSPVMART